jgi:hypothetical protein
MLAITLSFPLHTGTALEIAGRLAVSAMGFVVSLGLLAAMRALWRKDCRNKPVLISNTA